MHPQNFVAHRGWRQHFPENTLIAFREAIAAGAVNIEMDLQLSRDGVVFVFHDANLTRMCRQPGQIWDYTAAQLDQFRASEPLRLGDQFADTPLCRLSEIRELLLEHPGVNAFVELKVESLTQFGAERLLSAVLEELTPVANQCVLISFELDALLTAQTMGWQRLGAVFDHWPDWQSAALATIRPEVIFCDRHCVPLEENLHELPWPILIYEVGSRIEAEQWFARGAVAVETFLIGEMLQEFKLV